MNGVSDLNDERRYGYLPVFLLEAVMSIGTHCFPSSWISSPGSTSIASSISTEATANIPGSVQLRENAKCVLKGTFLFVRKGTILLCADKICASTSHLVFFWLGCIPNFCSAPLLSFTLKNQLYFYLLTIKRDLS